jgi:hypothetical protein
MTIPHHKFDTTTIAKVHHSSQLKQLLVDLAGRSLLENRWTKTIKVTFVRQRRNQGIVTKSGSGTGRIFHSLVATKAVLFNEGARRNKRLHPTALRTCTSRPFASLVNVVTEAHSRTRAAGEPQPLGHE